MLHRTAASAVLATTLLAAPALADDPCLIQTGGALGQPASWTISGGDPGAFWFLLFGVVEVPTPIFTITLDIPIDLYTTSLAIGAYGFLDPSGGVTYNATLPAGASFDGKCFRAQAALNFLPDTVTNLTRLPLSFSQSFRPTFTAPNPLTAITGGTAIEGDKGAIRVLGGSGGTSTTFDPRLEEFTDGILPFVAPGFTSSTVLADGRVLFCGGIDPVSGDPTADAIVYDPVANTATTVQMAHARLGHSTTLLNDGRVFVAGGLETISIDISDPSSLLDPATLLGLPNDIQVSTEFFDPNTNTFSNGPNLPDKRLMHSAVRRANGNVVISGGVSAFAGFPLITSAVRDFNPSTGSYGIFPGFMATARAGHDSILTASGDVLMIGGLAADVSTFLTTQDPADIVISGVKTIERFNAGGIPSTTVVGTFQTGRAFCSTANLADGSVLIAGGFAIDLSDPQNPLIENSAKVDRYFGGGVFATPVDMAEGRILPLLVQLDTGAVLVAGGLGITAEIYQP
ncbi:MAG: hypothetical protein R3F34_09260 [Planctomycetota bacterium]